MSKDEIISTIQLSQTHRKTHPHKLDSTKYEATSHLLVQKSPGTLLAVQEENTEPRFSDHVTPIVH